MPTYKYSLTWNGPVFSEQNAWATGILESHTKSVQIPTIDIDAFTAFKEFLTTLITSTEQTFDELFTQFKQHYNHPTYFRI